MKPILETHPDIISRDVEEKDLEIVAKQAIDLLKLCHKPHGIHPRAYAMAHPQIENKDPLRFFVTERGLGYINPVIIKAVQPYTHKEGCMSFPEMKPIDVERFNLVEVEYTPFHVGEKDINLTLRAKTKFSSLSAAIFQHEIEHFDNNLIFL